MTTSSEIMREIEGTRADIRRTVAALEQQLSAETLVNRYLVPAKASTREIGRAFGDAVKANPLALGVTVVGLSWLMLSPRRADGGRAIQHRGEAERRPDPSRPGDFVTDSAGNTYRYGLHDAAGAAPLEADRIRESLADAAHTVSAKASAAAESAREAIHSAKAWTADTAEGAAHSAREAIHSAKSWTAETASGAAETVKRRTGSAYEATRARAGKVRERVRSGAGQAGGYVREHPVAIGAALAIGGAALALVLARRARGNGAYHPGEGEEPSGMPETPYASGNQAEMTAEHRNPTTPLTPEEEVPVFSEGDVSVAASHASTAAGAETKEAADIGAPTATSEAPASIAVGAAPAGETGETIEEPAAGPGAAGNGQIRGGSSFGSTMDSNPDAIGRKA